MPANRRRIVRPRSDDDGYFEDLPMVGGAADAILYPDDISMLTEEEQEQWRRELRERVARKRPAGFAPWPDDKR